MSVLIIILYNILGFFCLLLGAAGWYTYAERRRIPKGLKPLPGPPGIPWVGIVHKLPPKDVYKKFKEWGDTYGPVYQVNLLGRRHVIITSEKAVHELLNERSAIYSDRPPLLSVTRSKLGGEYLPMLAINPEHPVATEQWARQRAFTHQLITKSVNNSFYGIPALETKRLLASILVDPRNFSQLFETSTSSMMCRLMFGNAEHSEKLKESAWTLLVQMSPTGPLPNRLTPLVNLPEWLSPWKRFERKRYEKQADWFFELQQEARDKISRGIDHPSWSRSFLEQQEKLGWEDREGAFTVGMMAVAAVFTIGSLLHTYFLAMVLHPEWQTKIHAEVDAANNGGMPTAADSERLPILRAVVKECLRWRPIVPTGVAHELVQDDVYNGMFVPKGAVVLPLEWGFSMDPNVYPEPEKFNPARWLEPGYPTYKEPLTMYPSITDLTTFGFGKRTCVAKRITDHVMISEVAGLAWAFKVSHKIDAAGKEIPVPWHEYNKFLITKAKSFVCDVAVRSEARAEIIVDQWVEAMKHDHLHKTIDTDNSEMLPEKV